ncbi:hypothetical protein JCM10207_007856 [Rhodosporidiobolus poonsookiae]
MLFYLLVLCASAAIAGRWFYRKAFPPRRVTIPYEVFCNAMLPHILAHLTAELPSKQARLALRRLCCVSHEVGQLTQPAIVKHVSLELLLTDFIKRRSRALELRGKFCFHEREQFISLESLTLTAIGMLSRPSTHLQSSPFPVLTHLDIQTMHVDRTDTHRLNYLHTFFLSISETLTTLTLPLSPVIDLSLLPKLKHLYVVFPWPTYWSLNRHYELLPHWHIVDEGKAKKALTAAMSKEGLLETVFTNPAMQRVAALDGHEFGMGQVTRPFYA